MSTTNSSAASPLALYEPLDIIGNGSFGIIRKVRRKADGEILARKELNFERMSERDRKQIVAEVNILKDLQHENIVRYIDRFVDRDAGILYILMEYCDGGDLSSVIKQCARLNRPLPEDTVWSYFYQLLLALQHCHFPSTKPGENGASDVCKRQQILHRDLKPENVFISGNNMVKLGDFGLSKALGQTSFANTYVGTPYYMSPELIQEKSYDTKSDIWSLGCLIYELCASKPPFHEAQTHSELSMLIRNGRIPPLPKGYSHSLTQVIKAMLNLNPAMRPSAQQLLQHERIDFARKVSETEKMLESVRTHKATVSAKERELHNLSAALTQRETALTSVMAQKDAEIERLTALTSQTDLLVKEAVSAREEELRVAVMRREEEVRTAMARREEEILEAIRRREEEINEAWKKREEELRGELSAAVQWVENRQKELAEEAEKLEQARVDLEKEAETMQSQKGRKEKTPFEEVKNLLAPFARIAHHEAQAYEKTPRKPPVTITLTPSASGGLQKFHDLNTPLVTKTTQQPFPPIPGSAMRGIVLTATGETLQTPAPFARANPDSDGTHGSTLTKIITDSPSVRLNFRKIFDFESEAEDDDADAEADGSDKDDGKLTTSGGSASSSSAGSDREAVDLNTPSRPVKSRSQASSSARSGSHSRSQSTSKSSSSSGVGASATKAQLPPTRLRRPSIRTSSGRPGLPTTTSLPNFNSETPSQPSSATHPRASVPATAVSAKVPTPRYDPSDEENLPSPFLRRVERERIAVTNVRSGAAASPMVPGARRKSNTNLLRVMAAANAANTTSQLPGVSPSASGAGPGAVKAS